MGWHLIRAVSRTPCSADIILTGFEALYTPGTDQKIRHNNSFGKEPSF